MRSPSTACAVLLGLVVIGLNAPAARAQIADVVLGDSSVSASDSEGVTSAAVRLINTGGKQQELPEVPKVVNRHTCVPSLIDEKNRTLPARATTSVSVIFPDGCFTHKAELMVDLDADSAPESLPPVTIKAPGSPTLLPWRALGVGAVVGVAACLIVAISGVVGWRAARKDIRNKENDRRAAYRRVTDMVNDRLRELRDDPNYEANWKPYKAPRFGPGDKIGQLAAGWSLKDSWVSNLTIGTTALVAIATSIDAFTAFLGAAPKAAFAVMSVAGLISGLIIALAITLSKVFGKKAEELTVAGCLIATSLTAGAALLQTGTLGAGAAVAFGMPANWLEGAGYSPLAVVALAVAAIVATVLTIYACRSLYAIILNGCPDNVPTIPEDALKAWAVDPASRWQKWYVEQRIRTAFRTWLDDDGTPTTPVGSELPSTVGGGTAVVRYDYESGQFIPELRASML